MKTMKQVLIFALLIAGTSAFSQQRGGFGPKEAGKNCAISDKSVIAQLNLSADQQAKLEEIRKDYRQKDSIAFADFRKQREQGQVERMKAFKSLLNKEQLDKFETKILLRADQAIFKDQSRHERMSKQHPRFQGHQRPQGMDMQPCKCVCMQKGMNRQASAQMKMGRECMGTQKMDCERSRQNGKSGQRSMAKISPEERAKKQTEHLTKALALNEKQSAGIQAINLKYAQKDSLNKKDRASFKKAMRAKQEEIRSVLNKDQKVKYDNFLEKGKKAETNPGIESKQLPRPL